MKFQKHALLFAFLFITGILAFAQKPDLNSKVPVDPDIKIGKLKNGITYYISVGSYILSAATGNYVLSISDKAIGDATITPNSICGNGAVTLTANVGANADVVDFSIDGGSTVALTDATNPYQYTTNILAAPQSVMVFVRSKNF